MKKKLTSFPCKIGKKSGLVRNLTAGILYTVLSPDGAAIAVAADWIGGDSVTEMRTQHYNQSVLIINAANSNIDVDTGILINLLLIITGPMCMWILFLNFAHVNNNFLVVRLIYIWAIHKHIYSAC